VGPPNCGYTLKLPDGLVRRHHQRGDWGGDWAAV